MAFFLTRKTRGKVVRGFDPFCSALAINCCQFSCCMPDVPQMDFPCSNNSAWMEQLIQVAPQVTLRDLVLPGTHDSASYSLPWFTAFSAAGRTQNCSVHEQLLRGARYLDIRMAGSGENDSDVYVYHGCLRCAKLDVILGEIQEFLEDHPNEFLLIEVVAEYGRDFTPGQRLHALKLLKETFGDKIYTEHNYQQLMTQWSLKEIVQEQKKNILFMTHPRIYGFEVDGVTYDESKIQADFGFVHSGRWMRSQWHNTRDVELVKQWNLEEAQKHGSDKQQMLNNQVVLTPGVGGAMDVMKLLIGSNSLRPVSFAAALYKSEVLDVFFRDHAEEPWNMVMFDYIDLTPALVSFLISLNFPPTLQILKAAVAPEGGDGSVDVTDKATNLVKRGCVLYLTNIQQDLELDSDMGMLTIAYKLGAEGEHHVLTIDFDSETEVLLSQFCKNEENCSAFHVKPEEHPKGGCVARGHICGKEEATANGDKTIMEFSTTEDNQCVFGIVQ